MRLVKIKATQCCLAVVITLMFLPGCHRFAYQELDSQLRLSAIDETKPVKTIRWSKSWGGTSKLWSPVECADDSMPGDCANKLPYCTNHGPGKVQVKMVWYSIPVLIGTLGYTMPVEVQVFCRAECPCKEIGEGP